MDALISIAPGLPLLPLLVFVAEVCVVTLSTLRIICIARGRRFLAPVLGFFEITIWLFAIGQIMQHLSDVSCYLAFALGFTSGNFLGMVIEKRLALGDVVVQIITTKDAAALIAGLRAADFGVTSLAAEGALGPVRVVFSVIRRRELGDVLALIRRFDPRAFYVVNDVQTTAAGIAPVSRTSFGRVVLGPLWPDRSPAPLPELSEQPASSF